MNDDRPGAESGPTVLPVPKSPFLPSENYDIRRLGEHDTEAPTVYIFQDVAEELIFTAQFRVAQMSVGVLTGGYYEGPAGRYVELRGFDHSRVVESMLEFAHQLRMDWPSMRQDKTLLEARLIPLGWFVSRPGCKAQPGPFELMIQLSFFNLPYHIGILIDPVSRELGVYHSGGSSRMKNVGFNLIRAAAKQTEQEDEDRSSKGT